MFAQTIEFSNMKLNYNFGFIFAESPADCIHTYGNRLVLQVALWLKLAEEHKASLGHMPGIGQATNCFEWYGPQERLTNVTLNSRLVD